MISVEVDNYYDNTKMKITLDPKLDPKANAQKYYQKYQKAKNSIDVLHQQIELTEKELFAVLERNNVQKVGIQGEKFDPNLHQAVAQIPSAIQKDHIAEVFQPGFTLNGRVLRAAMVAVSAGEAN